MIKEIDVTRSIQHYSQWKVDVNDSDGVSAEGTLYSALVVINHNDHVTEQYAEEVFNAYGITIVSKNDPCEIPSSYWFGMA